MRIVYWESEGGERNPAASESTAPFRSGRAGTAWLGETGLQTESRVDLSVNSTHALLGHGVVHALNALPLQGRLGVGLQVMIPGSMCDAARRVFYEADRMTYGARYEFVVGRISDGPEAIEYRIRIDNREYQRTLSRMQFLLSSAPREGYGVWIEL